MEQYRLALAIEPTHANAHYNLGAVLSEMQRLEEAKAELELALQFNPNHGLAKDLLDRVRERLEELDRSPIPPPQDSP
jgi:tetratricopeptide (TPR) repeat protein